MRTYKLLKPTGLVLAALCLTTIPSSAASATTINFDLNGVAPVVHQVDSSGSVTVPKVKVEFDGMSFKGWNTSPTGNGKSYDEGDTINNSTTLYAQWADGTHIGGGTVDPNPGGDEGEDPNPDPDPDPTPGEDDDNPDTPNPDGGNQDEDDNPNQDTNPDLDNNSDSDSNSDSDNDSNPNPGTITGDVSGGSNNGSSNNGGTGDTGRQDTALNPGSPTAGFINLTTLSNIKTAAPLAAIAAGALAAIAVLLLTNKEAKKVKQAKGNHRRLLTKLSSFITTFTHNKAYLTIASISALAILGGTFYLISTNTNAASGTGSTPTEDWGIYVDEDGVPYEGFFTIMPEEGATDYSTAITTWWKGGQKQYGETIRNGHWVYFDKDNDGIMARNKDVFLPTADDPDRWVRYGDDGAMIKGEYAVGDNWYHFDEETGAMTKGWYTLPPNDVFNYERKVCYDPTTGVMIKGVTRIDPTMTDPAQYGSLYDFDATSGNATWHLPVAEDLTGGKYPDSPTGGYQGDRRQRVLYAALSRLGAPYELNNIPNGFVCDGLTAWAYTQGTGETWDNLDMGSTIGTGDIGPADYEWDLIKNRNGIKTNLADFQPGDLIFWGTDDTLTRYPGALGEAGWPGYHAAIYYHDGLMIHSATSTGGGVHVYSAADYPMYNWLGGGSPYIAETSKVALPN